MDQTAAQLGLLFLFSARQMPNVAIPKDAMLVFVLLDKVKEDLLVNMTVIVHTTKSAKMQFVLLVGMLPGYLTIEFLYYCCNIDLGSLRTIAKIFSEFGLATFCFVFRVGTI